MTKRVVVNGNRAKNRPVGSIIWDEYWIAWLAQRRKDKTEEAAIRDAQEGGLSYRDLTRLLDHEPRTWRPVGTGDNFEN
jgi:hypothetical protein